MITFFDLKIVTLLTIITLGSGMLGLAGDKETAFSLKGPGDTPVVLGPGLISVPDHIEMGCTSTPDGQEIYFSRSETLSSDSNWTIYVSRLQGGDWSNPEVASFSGVYRDFNPFISHDGKYMLFYRESSNQTVDQEGTWIVEREGNSWGESRFLVDQYTVTTVDFKTFYCTASPRPDMDNDICKMTYNDGIFSEPQPLEGGLNSQWWDAHGCISPDGSYIVFDGHRPTSPDEFSMHVSFRVEGDRWSDAVNFNQYLDQSDAAIACLSPDGKYLFFSSNNDLYWVDAEILRALAPIDVSILKVKIKPRKPVVGGNIRLAATFLNKSNYYSAACDMHVYLSLQKKITRKSILMGSLVAKSLKPGRKFASN